MSNPAAYAQFTDQQEQAHMCEYTNRHRKPFVIEPGDPRYIVGGLDEQGNPLPSSRLVCQSCYDYVQGKPATLTRQGTGSCQN